MATKIRLKRFGKIRSPHYRIVVMDSRSKRDGQAIEEIGLYHPKNDPSLIRVNSECAQYRSGSQDLALLALASLKGKSGDLAVALPDGDYVNDLTAKSVTVKDGKLTVDQDPIVIIL